MIFEFVSQTSKMFFMPEKIPLLSKASEKAVSGVFLGLALLTMAGWVYLLGSVALKIALWGFYYFFQ